MFVDVIVDRPLPGPLVYRLADAPHAAEVVGRRVVVPLGRGETIGVVVGVNASPVVEPARIRLVRRVLTEVGALSDHWLALTRFAATYYQHSWGEVAIPALPHLLRKVPGARFEASLARMRRTGEPRASGPAGLRELTAEQLAAAAAIVAARNFQAFLLYGVTGSGKTEVYLEAIAERLGRIEGAQALILVPEINLTPQVEERLRARFAGMPIVSLHSGLTDVERAAAWLAAHEGRARVVLGTRLAVFASLPTLAMIVVDEEHDASFKAGDGARYSARDLAVKRAQMAALPVVLGSATPSLESWRRARDDRYRLLTLAARAGAAAKHEPPKIECVDLRAEAPLQGLAPKVREAVAATVARGEQAIVFINRRGYAPVIACAACGWMSSCHRCATFTAFHKTDGTLRCHHCGWQSRVPSACPTCGNPGLAAVGHGTQRVEEALHELLPAARIERIDRDTTQRRNAVREALAAVHSGAVDLLVGTQMIAKGHDFRRVALVAILNADAQLVAQDFRAPERLFAVLMQVAGRAGRAGQASRVLVQTRFPGHPLFAALARLDYRAFAERELAERASARMPPFVSQALLRAEARSLSAALDFLRAAAQAGTKTAGDAAIALYDAVPMPLAKLAGVHRAQLLVESPSRQALQRWLPRWLNDVREMQFARRVRWQVEVDPQEI
ncbi:MAG TPA: primosomal protein N' [Burkholderiaceae bacterium]|nr:primosomal protein N' [Burkholderiaceae bacterium]